MAQDERRSVIDRLLDEERFDAVPIDRRDFVRLAVATGGTLALPGEATADHESEVMTDTYQYLVDHVPTDRPIPTLAAFENASGLQALDEMDLEELRTTEQPEFTAYFQVRPEAVEDVLEVETLQELQWSPGNNPFWRLEAYEEDVFLPADEAVGLIDFEEMIAGLEHLQERHPDRLNVKSVGTSSGLYNFATRERESFDVWLTEVTNDVDDTRSFREKEKVLIFTQDSDERQGPEGMLRFVEDLLEGDEPEIEELLDDVVLLFMFNNPDGWLTKYVQYFDDERRTDEEIVRENEYRTVPPNGADPNRSYPTVGYLDPGNFHAEPNGSNLVNDDQGVDDDVTEVLMETIPTELNIAQYLRERDYQNLEYAYDVHGMYDAENFLEGFPLNGELDFAELHDVYRLQRSVRREVVENTDLPETVRSDEMQSLFEDLNEASESAEDVPTGAFEYGTLFDILGYTTTGDTISWLATSEENGGFDMTVFATETVYSIGEFVPELVDAWVTAVVGAIRATAKHAAEDVETTVRTDGTSTAYVTTGGLARSSEALSFTDGEQGNGGRGGDGGQEGGGGSWLGSSASGGQSTEVTRSAVTLEAGESTAVEVAVPDGAGELTVSVRSQATAAQLEAPDGEVVAQLDPRSKRDFGAPMEWTVTDPTPGQARLVVENLSERAPDFADVRVTVTDLQQAEHPDPRELLHGEFDQREYEVTPFRFFDEYETFVADDGPVEGVSVEDVIDGALVEDGSLAYENVVVIHDRRADEDDYLASLDEYVEAGGNLVLTDTGVHLLGRLANPLVEGIDDGDVVDENLFTSFVVGRDDLHPLLVETEANHREVGKFVPLGYAIGQDVPMTMVESSAFSDAGGEVAATTEGRYSEVAEHVSLGSFFREEETTGVHVIASILRPGNQRHLHAFGLSDYSISFFGTELFTNALGYRAEQTVDGESVSLGASVFDYANEEGVVPDDGLERARSDAEEEAIEESLLEKVERVHEEEITLRRVGDPRDDGE